MRRTLIILAITMLSLTSLAQKDSASVASDDVASIKKQEETGESTTSWDKANRAYSEGQFQVAEVLYMQLIEEGYQDASLYYNLGNTYFQQNQIGKAILNYKRAYLANPSDKDIQYNLELAQSKTKDKIDKLPSFFLFEWIDSIRDLMDTNTWAETAIFLLLIDLCMIMLWLLANSLGIRKLGFYSAILLTVLVVVSIVNSFRSANHVYNSAEAVVTSSAALIKSSPSDSGKDLFVVHEGTSLLIKQNLDGWNEVELIDGNKGWITSSAIEKVLIDKE